MQSHPIDLESVETKINEDVSKASVLLKVTQYLASIEHDCIEIVQRNFSPTAPLSLQNNYFVF